METKTGLVECLMLYVMPSEECKKAFGSIPWNQKFGFLPPSFVAEDTS